MRYKTVIEVETDAKTRNEALEIVDDYLAGNLVRGVSMRCATRPVRNVGRAAISVATGCALIAIVAMAVMHADPASKAVSFSPAASTMQAPLKTKSADDFKSQWDKKQSQEAIESLKKIK